MSKNWAPPRLVDFRKVADDMETGFLGLLGFSTKFISQRTGYSSGQIQYRLHKGDVKRADYRNGISREACLVLGEVYTSASVRRSAGKHLKHAIREKAKVRKRKT